MATFNLNSFFKNPTALISLVGGILPLASKEGIHSQVQRAVTLDRNVHKTFRDRMPNEKGKAQLDDLRTKMADATAEYVLLAASQGAIEPDEGDDIRKK